MRHVTWEEHMQLPSSASQTKHLSRHSQTFELTTHGDRNHYTRPSMAPSTPIVARSRDMVNSHFDDQTFSDLEIKLSDRVVHVHRVVLCRGSEYFTSLPTGSFKVG
jgi:hypothetical protein